MTEPISSWRAHEKSLSNFQFVHLAVYGFVLVQCGFGGGTASSDSNNEDNLVVVGAGQRASEEIFLFPRLQVSLEEVAITGSPTSIIFNIYAFGVVGSGGNCDVEKGFSGFN